MRKKSRNKKITMLILVLLILFSTGCEKKENKVIPQVNKVVNVAKSIPAIQGQQSSLQLKASAAPQALTENSKDPFRPYVLETKPIVGSGTRGLLPIQNYEVGQFQILGIITGLKQNSALVADPTGRAYVVKTGMEIGKNGGHIEKISNKFIEIEEKFVDESGKIKTRTVRLTLPRKE